MKASADGHSDVVKLLLSAGASLNKKDRVSCIIYNSMGRVIGSMIKNHQHILVVCLYGFIKCMK